MLMFTLIFLFYSFCDVGTLFIVTYNKSITLPMGSEVLTSKHIPSLLLSCCILSNNQLNAINAISIHGS